MRKVCTLITSKGTDKDENIANQNHATRTRTPKPGYLNTDTHTDKLLKMQKRAARIITGSTYEVRSKYIFNILHWEPIETALKKREMIMTFKRLSL